MDIVVRSQTCFWDTSDTYMVWRAMEDSKLPFCRYIIAREDTKFRVMYRGQSGVVKRVSMAFKLVPDRIATEELMLSDLSKTIPLEVIATVIEYAVSVRYSNEVGGVYDDCTQLALWSADHHCIAAVGVPYKRQYHPKPVPSVLQPCNEEEMAELKRAAVRLVPSEYPEIVQYRL
jgi:hypothetical protein